jgi:autotransporter-associated beta strand protein
MRTSLPSSSQIPQLRSKLVRNTVAGLCLLSVSPAAFASVWTGGSGNWSDNSATGWNGTGVPDGIGAIADFANGATGTVTVDISTRTLGTLTTSLGNFTRSLTLTNGLIMNQDGAGAGVATISNTNASTNVNNRLSIGLGVITLADDLQIINSGGSTNGTGAVTFSGTLAGSGNLTLNNVSNSITSGAIQLSGANSTFTGAVSIQRGAVVANSLGASANAVALGSSGNSATLVSQGSTTNIANNITVASTSGTNVLGSTSTAAASNSIFSGSIILNGGVTLSSVKGAGADVRYTGVISGVGSVRTAGSGETQFGNGVASVTNTYSGNTTLTETSSFVLSDNAKLTFYIGANGVNNQITGSGQTLTLDGDFVFNLTNAAAVGSWTIVDVANLTETFGSTFTVVGFTNVGDIWTSGDGNYSFNEATGVLTAVPEPSTVLLSGLGLACLLFRVRRGSRAGN